MRKLQHKDESTLGLVLTGGGARAAYQVGVLKGIAEHWGGAPGALSRSSPARRPAR